jgi:hypothetical protein
MVLSQTKEIKHHADELSKVLGKHKDIESWVVGKIERASTDLSDVTHYLDGTEEKMKNGGGVNNDMLSMDLKSIKLKYPKAKVSYTFAKDSSGKGYVITARENGKVVYTSYKMAKGGGIEEDYKIKRFLDTVKVANNKIKLQDITVESTPKGNWTVYVKGDVLMNVKGSLLDEQTIDKYDLRHIESKYAKGGELGGFCYSIGGL